MSRDSEVARIEAVLATLNYTSDPDAVALYGPQIMVAAALYDAGLRSTSRDSEVRAAIEALRVKHHEHVHRDGCHRWFDHDANRLTDLAGPAGWCDGCTENWPCDTTRALNLNAHSSEVFELSEALDVERST